MITGSRRKIDCAALLYTSCWLQRPQLEAAVGQWNLEIYNRGITPTIVDSTSIEISHGIHSLYEKGSLYLHVQIRLRSKKVKLLGKGMTSPVGTAGELFSSDSSWDKTQILTSCTAASTLDFCLRLAGHREAIVVVIVFVFIEVRRSNTFT